LITSQLIIREPNIQAPVHQVTKSKYINAAAHGGELVGGTEELGELRQRVHIDRAAERTVEVLGEPTGVVVIID
jgi:hypothetical protein